MSDGRLVADLVRRRMADLELDRRALVARMGYSNAGKGYRRADAVLAGDVTTALKIRDRLGAALEIAPDEIDAAAAEERRRWLEAVEAAYRQSFRPHAIAMMERQVPSPIFVAALTGAERKRRIDFPDDASPASFPTIARRALPEWLPGFGRSIGFAVNYTPDHAVRFGLDCQPLEVLDRAMRLGCATLTLGSGRDIAPFLKPR